MNVTRFRCPDCGKGFRAGPDMRLGPGQAQCGCCGGVFNTGLKNWNEYTAGGKLLLVTKELLDPFDSKHWWEWIYWQMVTLILFGGISFGITYLAGPRSGNSEGFMIITFLVIYFGLYGFRLIRRIVICKQFSKTGKPPVWANFG